MRVVTSPPTDTVGVQPCNVSQIERIHLNGCLVVDTDEVSRPRRRLELHDRPAAAFMVKEAVQQSTLV